MKRRINILILLLSLTISFTNAQSNKKEISFESSDGVTVTADLYLTPDTTAPFLVLCHQAGYSRGEYIETAPKFNALGYNCIAIDQRSGREVNGVKNKTKISAKKKFPKSEYIDAMADLEAAINYVQKNHKAEKLIIMGSSYSATLSILIAAKYPEEIDAVLAFSPGEYFRFENKKIKEFASNIKIPVFITSAKNEESMWKEIYDSIPTESKSFYLPEVNGIHGSRSLWEAQEGNEGYWEAVKEFLGKL